MTTLTKKINWKKLFLIQSIFTTALYLISFASNYDKETIAIGIDKMNVFYIGLDNPITIAASQTANEELVVSSVDVQIESKGNGKYNVKATTPGKAVITIKLGNGTTQDFYFRVKRIPDPVAKIGRQKGGMLSPGLIQAQQGIIAQLENFDIDATCKVISYEVTRVSKSKDPVSIINKSGRFEPATKALIDQAAVGDVYYFDNILTKCPGDQVAYPINSMVFKIR